MEMESKYGGDKLVEKIWLKWRKIRHNERYKGKYVQYM